jgi:hypothetical protein
VVEIGAASEKEFLKVHFVELLAITSFNVALLERKHIALNSIVYGT